jgi:hypothetical protein
MIPVVNSTQNWFGAVVNWAAVPRLLAVVVGLGVGVQPARKYSSSKLPANGKALNLRIRFLFSALGGLHFFSPCFSQVRNSALH